MKKLFVITLFLMLLSIACSNQPPKSEPAGKTPTAGQTGETKPLPPDAELFVYRWGAGDIGLMEGGDQGEIQVIVADVVSGDIVGIYPLNVGKQPIFSPDFSSILYIEEIYEPRSLNAHLIDRASGDEIWRIPLQSPDEGWSARYRNANWDMDRGYIILEGIGFKINRKPEEEAETFTEFSWWFLTIDLRTGKEIARLNIMDKAPVRIIPAETQAGAVYTNGKLYLPLPEYPVTEYKSFGRYDTEADFDIYAIDPITGEGARIDIRDMLSLPIEAKFFPTSDGSTLFVQTHQLSERGSPQMMGGSIHRIDLKTGKWELLVDYTPTEAYNLRGITPDGSRLLYAKRTMNRNNAPEEVEIVRDMATGDEIEIPAKGRAKQLWISPSGKYIVSFAWSSMPGIVVFEVDTGVERILDESEPGQFPYPLRFLGGLGNGI